MPGSLMLFGRELSCSSVAPTCSTSTIRMSSATGRSRARCTRALGWRIGDHRAEFALGGYFAVEQCASGELADARPLLDELDFQAEQDSGLDGFAELHAVDRHEINELAGASEPEAFDGEHASRLGQRLDLQDSGHDRPSREMALEELFIHAHRLDRHD